MPRQRRFLVLAFAGVIGVAVCAVSCGVFAWVTCFGGPPPVDVEITGFRPGTYFYCAVVDTGGELHALHGFARLITPIDLEPGAYRDPDAPPDSASLGWVTCKSGDRYGVVQRSVDKKWTVTWFDAREVAGIEARLVTFDLSKGHTEPLADDAIPALELNDVADPDLAK